MKGVDKMGFDPRFGNDPMWNVARTTNLMKQQLETEKEAQPYISQKERRKGYILITVLLALLIGIILLFILL